jgi:NAD(P)-dependent dehydrogenase (short-subunit alcohol dehydrogenase family)
MSAVRRNTKLEPVKLVQLESEGRPAPSSPLAPTKLFSLEGKIALVAGASGGIGSVLARGLAAAGATVALNGRDHRKLEGCALEIEAEGGRARIFPADVTDPDEIRALVSRLEDDLGGVDILVNCVGINKREPMLEVTPETFRRIVQTNLESVYFLSQAVMPVMRERGGGKIVHIGSLSAAVGLSEVSVYGMTKAALAQLTKTMAIECAPMGITVNCLCPGFIATDLTVPLWENERRKRWMLERLPLNRAGTPEDLVGMTVLMCSRASDYMTGQSVFVDGGFLAGSEW